MKKEKIALTTNEEIKRAQTCLLRGECFISKVPLNDKEYDLVWHTGANTYVFVAKEFTQNLLNEN